MLCRCVVFVLTYVMVFGRVCMFSLFIRIGIHLVVWGNGFTLAIGVVIGVIFVLEVVGVLARVFLLGILFGVYLW